MKDYDGYDYWYYYYCYDDGDQHYFHVSGDNDDEENRQNYYCYKHYCCSYCCDEILQNDDLGDNRNKILYFSREANVNLSFRKNIKKEIN